MKDFKFVLSSFFIWRIILFLVAFLSIYLIPVFGGRYPYFDTVLQVTKLPNWVWGFGGFDGVHYLKLAQDGYTAANYQAFFPLYPLLIRFLNLFPKDTLLNMGVYVDPSYFYTGLILSNLFFVGSLYFFYKLLRLDFSEKISRLSIILLLVFPTAFYFGSIYTESLFMFLLVSGIYFFRTKKFFLAGALAALASATRVIGVLIPIVYLVEIIKERSINWKKIASVVISPFGFIFYAFYLDKTFGNPLSFLAVQPGFGAERSSLPLITLPQVIYRYFKILTAVDIKSLVFLNAGLELTFSLVALSLLIYYYRKIRLSYLVFSLFALIIPTMTGTLSSMPRYVLVAFPIFPLLSQISNKNYKILMMIFCVLQVVLLSMFVRGYWVA